MPEPPLTGKQARHLRALAHSEKPVAQVGKHGLSDALASEIEAALLAHELIKIKVAGEAPTTPQEFGQAISEKLGARVAQILGRTVLLYRRHPKKPRIQLPGPTPVSF